MPSCVEYFNVKTLVINLKLLKLGKISMVGKIISSLIHEETEDHHFHKLKFS